MELPSAEGANLRTAMSNAQRRLSLAGRWPLLLLLLLILFCYVTTAATAPPLQEAPWPDGVYSSEEGEAAVARLQEILARPAFQWQEQQPSLLEQLWERFLRLLYDLLPAAAGSRPLALLLTLAGLLFLGGALAFAARSLFSSFTASAETEAEEELPDDLTPDAALERAQQLSRSGDYRSAVRYLYLSTLLLLDERGVLRYDRSRTNREYLASVAERPQLATTLREVVNVFDRVWYGYQQLDAEAYARYEAQVNALKRQK